MAHYNGYVTDGDVLKAVVTGTNPVTITAYINDNQVMSVQDSGQFLDKSGAVPLGALDDGESRHRLFRRQWGPQMERLWILEFLGA